MHVVIFSHDYRDLERAVEELSGQLESPIEQEMIPAMRQRVTDCTYIECNFF